MNPCKAYLHRYYLEENYRRLAVMQKEQMLAEERERIMRDMHDGIGGHLVTMLSLVEHTDTCTQNRDIPGLLTHVQIHIQRGPVTLYFNRAARYLLCGACQGSPRFGRHQFSEIR
jgi:hypothetical protein